MRIYTQPVVGTPVVGARISPPATSSQGPPCFPNHDSSSSGAGDTRMCSVSVSVAHASCGSVSSTRKAASDVVGYPAMMPKPRTLPKPPLPSKPGAPVTANQKPALPVKPSWCRSTGGGIRRSSTSALLTSSAAAVETSGGACTSSHLNGETGIITSYSHGTLVQLASTTTRGAIEQSSGAIDQSSGAIDQCSGAMEQSGGAIEQSDSLSDCTSESGYNSPQSFVSTVSVNGATTTADADPTTNIDDVMDQVLCTPGRVYERRRHLLDNVNDNNAPSSNSRAQDRHCATNTRTKQVNSSTAPNGHAVMTGVDVKGYADNLSAVDDTACDDQNIYDCVHDESSDEKEDNNTDDEHTYISSYELPPRPEVPPPPVPAPYVYSVPDKSRRQSCGNIQAIDILSTIADRRLSLKTDDVPILPVAPSKSSSGGTFSKTKNFFMKLRKNRKPVANVFTVRDRSKSITDMQQYACASDFDTASVSCQSVTTDCCDDTSSCASSDRVPPPLPLSLPPVDRLSTRADTSSCSDGDSTDTISDTPSREKKKKHKKPLLSKLKHNGFSKSLSDLRATGTLTLVKTKSTKDLSDFGSVPSDFTDNEPINGYQSSCDNRSLCESVSSESSSSKTVNRGQVSHDWHKEHLKRMLDSKHEWLGEAVPDEAATKKKRYKRKSMPQLTINARNLHKITEKFNTSVSKIQSSLSRASITDAQIFSRLRGKKDYQNEGSGYTDADEYESEYDSFSDDSFDEECGVAAVAAAAAAAAGDGVLTSDNRPTSVGSAGQSSHNSETDSEYERTDSHIPAGSFTHSPFTAMRRCLPPLPKDADLASSSPPLTTKNLPKRSSSSSSKSSTGSFSRYDASTSSAQMPVLEPPGEFLDPPAPPDPSRDGGESRVPRVSSRNKALNTLVPSPSANSSSSSSSSSSSRSTSSKLGDVSGAARRLPTTALMPPPPPPPKCKGNSEEYYLEPVDTEDVSSSTQEAAAQDVSSCSSPARGAVHQADDEDDIPKERAPVPPPLTAPFRGRKLSQDRSSPPALSKDGRKLSQGRVNLLAEKLRNQALQEVVPSSTKAPPSFGVQAHALTKSSTSSKDLNSYPWCFPNIRREKAQSILKGQETGTFLVRQKQDSADTPYVLSLVHNHRCWHLQVRLRGDGSMALGQYKEGERTFTDLPELVSYYQRESLYLWGNDGGYVLLKSPPIR